MMSNLLTRDKVEEQYKWDLTDLYPSQEAWMEDFRRLEGKIPQFEDYRGKIAASGSVLYDCLNFDDEISLLSERLYIYAHLLKDQNTKEAEAQVIESRIRNLLTEVRTVSSFVVPEILTIDEEMMEEYYQRVPDLLFYKKVLDRIFRGRDHALPAEQEALLAQYSELFSSPSRTFTMLDNADLQFPTIEVDGESVRLTKGRYSELLESTNRENREKAYVALYETYGALNHTLATTYTSHVQRNVTSAKVRHYPGFLEAALFSDNVPTSVYDNLVQSVKHNLSHMHKYIALRKRLLAVKDLHMYDVYVPLVSDVDRKYTYEEAYDVVLQGLTPLGDDYLATLREAKASRWIDVYETDGKRSGAYQSSFYGVHPYVLLNFNGTLDSVFTIAHEMGHAMHSYYSDENNPYTYAQYTIFVAEVASTVNEILLVHHLLNKTNDQRVRAYLVNHFLDQFRGTVYRQTMFAEFEKIVHERIAKGEPVMAKELNEIYAELNRTYYGDGVVTDEHIAKEWSRIPHFYNSFYVYKYATGFSAAVAIAKRILAEGQPAVEQYKAFLRSGGMDYPIELLKIAGVDMSSPKPVDDALTYFGELVMELEQLSATI